MTQPTTTVWISANTTRYALNTREGLIRRLQEEGFGVTVVAPADNYVRRIKALGAEHIDLPMVGDAQPLRDAQLTARYWRLLRYHRPAALLSFTHNPNTYGAFVAHLFAIPVIANVAGLGSGFTTKNPLVRRLVKLLYRITRRCRSHVFFQNNEDLAYFEAHRMIRIENAGRLPGSGVDPGHFNPRYRQSGHPFTFLFSGRLLWEKGISEYVAAARRLRSDSPTTRFQLLGFVDANSPGGISAEQIEAWSQEGIIEFLGRSDDVRNQYAACDCIVLPSYYREGVPRTLLEGASMAIPLITTDTPGCRDAIEDDVTGLLVQPRDVDDLTAKMRSMIQMTGGERRRMGLLGRDKMCREFSQDIVIDRYLEVLTRLGVADSSARNGSTPNCGSPEA